VTASARFLARKLRWCRRYEQDDECNRGTSAAIGAAGDRHRGGLGSRLQLFDISPLILPPPFAIASRFYLLVASGDIWPHLWATVVEIVSGFVFGVVAGLVIGAMVSLIPVIERLIYPYLVALQTLQRSRSRHCSSSGSDTG